MKSIIERNRAVYAVFEPSVFTITSTYSSNIERNVQWRCFAPFLRKKTTSAQLIASIYPRSSRHSWYFKTIFRNFELRKAASGRRFITPLLNSPALSIIISVEIYRTAPRCATAIRTLCLPSFNIFEGIITVDNVAIFSTSIRKC